MFSIDLNHLYAPILLPESLHSESHYTWQRELMKSLKVVRTETLKSEHAITLTLSHLA